MRISDWSSDVCSSDLRGGVCVAALDIAVADENGKASAEQQRDAEADAVAELCARLIDSQPIIDRRSGTERPCQPGDIALLRSEEHTSELQSLMRISYAVFCLKKKKYM